MLILLSFWYNKFSRSNKLRLAQHCTGSAYTVVGTCIIGRCPKWVCTCVMTLLLALRKAGQAAARELNCDLLKNSTDEWT